MSQMSTMMGIFDIEKTGRGYPTRAIYIVETDSKRRPCRTFSRSYLGQHREKEGEKLNHGPKRERSVSWPLPTIQSWRCMWR
jgi:hypothetical protein